MWLRLAHKKFSFAPNLTVLAGLGVLFILFSCSSDDRQKVDELNDLSYAYHYRDLDSTSYYAQTAYGLSAGYADGKAEALNNLAFVDIARMRYRDAQRLLDSVPQITDNQLELLVSYIQQMRLCQRESRNRDFYDCRSHAQRALMRINEERHLLNNRQLRRLLYAESELAIVTSTYYYYVGLEQQSVDAILDVPADVQQDTIQYLNYLYNVGAGGIISQGTQRDINQEEFDYLMRCFLLSREVDCPFFAANSLEAIAELLIPAEDRAVLIEDNLPALTFINPTGVDDEYLPLWLADNALATFREYGDVYQIAGAYRTLASCCLSQNDYESTLFNLEQALSDTIINQAPDLVASIREQLSVAYAAMDNKVESDHNRNIYLDLQEQTRQDRSLEARAAQLEHSLTQQNWLLAAVVIAILLLVLLIYYLHRRVKRRSQSNIDKHLQEREEELSEQLALTRQRIETQQRMLLEQRAKVSLVNGITPFIDRILHEVRRPSSFDESYVRELIDEINHQNDVLTHWIQLRQGQLSLHIETFRLQELFALLQKSQRSFKMKGLTLNVEPTDVSVKADRVLTIFMLNTLADNARKFTPEGGTITVSANATEQYVEVSVTDTGVGMSEEQLEHLFDHKVITDTNQQSHGFGLLNCKGIIEKYRKISQIFAVCMLGAESEIGKGSRLYFRLPRRMLMLLGAIFSFSFTFAAHSADPLAMASAYADSAYFSNVDGTYERTLMLADSCRRQLNAYYMQSHTAAADTLLRMGDVSAIPPEIIWYHDSLRINYSILLRMRNESAVAALALHQWSLYRYNNRIYTLLFKEMSADSTLDDYCRKMQQAQTNRQVATIILLLLFVAILLSLAWQIALTLRKRASRQKEYEEQLELMADELHRLRHEENTLYVSNAVLDNTLSTLKHETMYYPSRIRQLIDNGDTQSVNEVVAYYRELYGLLSIQSMRQLERTTLRLQPLEHNILGNEILIRYLFDILKKQNGNQALAIDYDVRDALYVDCRVRMTALHLSEEEAHGLFMPQIANIPYLLCRQIVRDHGETSNRRACAIRAEIIDNTTTIIITLPSICKTSKLLS